MSSNSCLVENCFLCSKEFEISSKDYVSNKRYSDRFYFLVCRYLSFDYDSPYRYLTIDINGKSGKNQNEIQGENIFCCEKCDSLIKSFCQIYDQWSNLQLKLNWKLGQISDLTKIKRESPSSLKTCKSGSKQSKRSVFLKKLQSRCKDFPRLKLAKLRIAGTDFNKPSSSDDLDVDQSESHFEIEDSLGFEVGSDDDDHHHGNLFEQDEFENESTKTIKAPPPPEIAVSATVKSESDNNNVIMVVKNKKGRKKLIHEKSFQCKTCLRRFRAKQVLINHMRTHTGEKPFKCRFCDKAFAVQCNLTAHEMIHTGQNAFACSVCGKVFSTKRYRDNHKQVHSGNSRFVCGYCGNAFSSQLSLKGHETSHTGSKPFLCKSCPMTFARIIYLRKHELTHSGSKPFMCQFCGKGFAQSSTRIIHEKAVHQGIKRKKKKKNLQNVDQVSAPVASGSSNAVEAINNEPEMENVAVEVSILPN